MFLSHSFLEPGNEPTCIGSRSGRARAPGDRKGSEDCDGKPSWPRIKGFLPPPTTAGWISGLTTVLSMASRWGGKYPQTIPENSDKDRGLDAGTDQIPDDREY